MAISHEYYMQEALRLAKKGEGRTSPNPLVGAVLVKRNRIVGRGYHRGVGLPHAEVDAISDAGRDSKDSILYVTLEPCSSFGRTPPCTDLIIASKIKEVVIAAKDPNPVNKNKGIKALRASGIS